MSGRRMWWTSFGRAALGAAVIIGALALLASVFEVYFLAIVLLVLTFLYRREILITRAPEPLEIAPGLPPVTGAIAPEPPGQPD